MSDAESRKYGFMSWVNGVYFMLPPSLKPFMFSIASRKKPPRPDIMIWSLPDNATELSKVNNDDYGKRDHGIMR